MGEVDHADPSMAANLAARMSQMMPGTHKPIGPEVYWDVPDNEYMCLECVGTIKLPVVCLSSNKVGVLGCVRRIHVSRITSGETDHEVAAGGLSVQQQG